MIDTLCGCIKCTEARTPIIDFRKPETIPGPSMPGWRYACEICGNKRCPHHSDHELQCTGSNEPGQPGSVFT